jgi:protein O-mannosyl-transferase
MLAGMVIIAALACIVYSPSINGGFILDDDYLLTENNLIKATNGLNRLWFTAESQDYWPLTNSTFWIEWRLWGLQPTGYHATNLLLHIATSLMIWAILRKMSVPGAYFAALIFAVHPVNVESIAWISQRKNLLALFFFLSSIQCYLNAEIQSSKQNTQAHFRFGLWYCISLAAFILALLSKGSVVVLPVIWLGIIWWRRKVTLWDMSRMVPFFVAAGIFTGINIWFQKHGSDIVLRDATFLERVLGAAGVLWFYLYKALLPLDLAFVYPQWCIQVENPLWWISLVGAIAFTVIFWLYRNSWSRPFLFAWGFFCTALVPVMGFTDVGFMKYSLVADHYLHIAIIGVIALATAGFTVWRRQTSNAMQTAATIFGIIVLATLMSLCWQQSNIYRNALTLYQTAIKKNPEFMMGHSNLGAEYFKAGRFAEAIECYENTIRLKYDYPAAHNNLALIFIQTGRLQDAVEQLNTALKLKKDYIAAENNLGLALIKLRRFSEAVTHFENAVQLNPDSAKAYYNLAKAYANTNDVSHAVAAAQKGLQLAQSQGLTETAQQFEDWLKKYHATLSEHPNTSQPDKSILPPANSFEHYRLPLDQ